MIKTRTVLRRDGCREVLRVLSADSMDDWVKSDPLAYEKSIVWLTDIDSLPYVRVKHVRSARSRRGPLHVAGNVRVVGYAKLTADAPRNPDGQTYTRRLFYLLDEDTAGPVSAAPAGSLVPTTILPGSEGGVLFSESQTR